MTFRTAPLIAASGTQSAEIRAAGFVIPVVIMEHAKIINLNRVKAAVNIVMAEKQNAVVTRCYGVVSRIYGTGSAVINSDIIVEFGENIISRISECTDIAYANIIAYFDIFARRSFNLA